MQIVDLLAKRPTPRGWPFWFHLSWGGLPRGYGFQHLNLPRSTFAGADWEYNKNRVDTLYVSLAHDFGEGWKLNFNGTYVDRRSELLATWLLPAPDVGGYGHGWWANQTLRDQKADMPGRRGNSRNRTPPT